jgi:hypothetical protein
MKFLLSFLLLISYSFAQDGTIPRYYNNDPASDLIYQDPENPILPYEVDALREQSKGKFDISLLNPSEKTDLWVNQMGADLKELEKKHSKTIPIEYMEVVDYHSPVPSRSGNFRFNVIKQIGDDSKVFNLYISKNIRNILLAGGLLSKIGYKIPAMKFLPQVQIRFKSEEEKKGFIAYLEQEAMAGEAEYWVIGEDKLTIIMQDVVAFEGLHLIYNLAMGQPPEGVIADKRLLRSLAVPYALVNVPESVNLWRWQAGRIVEKKVALDLPQAGVFNCSWEDARWITRRIEKLTAQDFTDIVDAAHVPKPVGALMVQKLLARRNSLMSLFSLDAYDLPVNDKVSSGVELVDGKLTQEYWPGYASRFAFGDPDSPLSGSEMMSWGQSKAISYVIDGAVAGINSIPFLSTDIQGLNETKLKDYLNKNLQETANGKIQVTPLATWTFPTYKSQVGLSRSLVAGSYLGTDNLVQLADSISVSVAGGLYTGVGGLFPAFANVTTELAFSRSYAHLRPVTSVKKSLKYPFKNLIVPLLHGDYGKKLSAALSLDLESLPENERQMKVEEALKPLKENLAIGESLIVTDSLSAGLLGRVGVNKNVFVKAQLGLGATEAVLRRVHIFRKSENVIQIYQDFGETTKLQMYFAFNSVLPVLKAQGLYNRGSAKVQYYTLSLNVQNLKVLEHVAALRSALVFQSLKKVKKVSKPFVIHHTFNEKGSNLGLFSLRLNHVNSYTRMTVENPKDSQPRYFFRRYRGKTFGMDYQDYFNDVISNTVSLLFDTNINPSSSSTNPGYSFLGKAVNKLNTFEAEIDKDENIIEPFMRFNRVYNGWSIQREKALKILESIRNRYRFEFYEPTVLSSTQKLYLYNINVNFLIYQKGIESMMNTSAEDATMIFKDLRRRDDLTINNTTEEPFMNGIKRFLRFQRKAKTALEKKDLKKYSDFTQKMFNIAEKKLNLEGLMKLLGGDENFYIYSRIDGFRVGDEDGDKSIISNSLGEFGNKHYFGPLQDLVGKTEMIEGEFFLYWMMTRVI